MVAEYWPAALALSGFAEVHFSYGWKRDLYGWPLYRCGEFRVSYTAGRHIHTAEKAVEPLPRQTLQAEQMLQPLLMLMCHRGPRPGLLRPACLLYVRLSISGQGQGRRRPPLLAIKIRQCSVQQALMADAQYYMAGGVSRRWPASILVRSAAIGCNAAPLRRNAVLLPFFFGTLSSACCSEN